MKLRAASLAHSIVSVDNERVSAAFCCTEFLLPLKNILKIHVAELDATNPFELKCASRWLLLHIARDQRVVVWRIIAPSFLLVTP